MDLKKQGAKKQVPDPKIMSGRPDKLEQWVQIDWASVQPKNE